MAPTRNGITSRIIRSGSTAPERSRVELTVEPCDVSGHVRVRMHAWVEDPADGSPQTVDAVFELAAL